MPLYTAQCKTCNQETDYYSSVANRDTTPQCQCGGETKKIISTYRVHGDMEPYLDENLDTYIKSKQHRQQVMREKGVTEGYGKGWDIQRSRSKH
jgi:putative FmdB family regulatory protein